MFEKEANEYAKEVTKKYVFMEHGRASALGFQKGAEFGYNKGKEDAKEELEQIRNERNFFQKKCEDIEYNYYCDKVDCQFLSRNKWHYVKDGDLPKDTTSLYLVRVDSWNFSFSHLYKKYTTYIPTVCEWNGEYFTALDDMAYSNARNINSCVAWKEIIPPELEESE